MVPSPSPGGGFPLSRRGPLRSVGATGDAKFNRCTNFEFSFTALFIEHPLIVVNGTKDPIPSEPAVGSRWLMLSPIPIEEQFRRKRFQRSLMVIPRS